MRDSFSALERPLVGPYRKGFAWVSAPMVRALKALGVSPNAVSASQIAVGVVIVLVLGSAPGLGFGLMLLCLFIDSLDGALARAYGRYSQFGALVDQIADHVRETLVIAALALHGGLHPVVAVLYPIIQGTFNVVTLLCNLRDVPVPWSVKSYLTVYPVFFLWAFFGVNWLTAGVALAIGFMALTIVLALQRLSGVMDTADGTPAVFPPA
ncbi:MAG: CDP-alcohol phosphatidyltransferase family protein [Dehalococcoidia bacterium]|nr:CDP-alcohol phosphatidyltransferase family protein [Dehalococcoidia bacterium]